MGKSAQVEGNFAQLARKLNFFPGLGKNAPKTECLYFKCFIIASYSWQNVKTPWNQTQDLWIMSYVAVS